MKLIELTQGMKFFYSTSYDIMSWYVLLELEFNFAKYFIRMLILLLLPSLKAKCNGDVFYRVFSNSSIAFLSFSLMTFVTITSFLTDYDMFDVKAFNSFPTPNKLSRTSLSSESDSLCFLFVLKFLT